MQIWVLCTRSTLNDTQAHTHTNTHTDLQLSHETLQMFFFIEALEFR